MKAELTGKKNKYRQSARPVRGRSRFAAASSNGGSSTLEILIAFAILTMTMTAVISVVFGNQSISVDTQTDNEALYKAQAQLEQARADSRQNFSSVVSQSSVEPSGPISYTKTLAVTDVDFFTKLVKSTVTWLEGGRTLNVFFSTLLTDPNSAMGGDTCNPILSGDWTQPQLLGTADVGQNNGGTDADVLGNKAYVTANAASAGKPDFYIVNVSNPNLSNLPILGSVNTGPGLAAVHVAGKYAYVANISTVTQLQIIDISVPSAPVVVASLDLTAAGDTAVGNSIFYANKRVYLGLTNSDGPEFYVLNVSNPLSPSVKASFETNTQINAITVKNNIAYLATRYGSDGVTPEQLRILDVSQADAGIISELNPFSPNPSTMSGESLYISKDGQTLYLGEGGANPANKPEFFSVNVTNPSSISQINSKYIPTSNDVTVSAISVRSNLAFLWTSDTNLNFQIWDLNNLSSPTPYGSLNTAQTATGGFECNGNILYTAQRSNKALQIIGPGGIAPTVALVVHNAAHATINTAAIGDTVHASIAVSGSAGMPTGKVDFTFYTSGDCSSGASSDPGNSFTLDGIGVVDPSSDQVLSNAGPHSFKAHYQGDANYNPADSACKTVTVTQATPTISTEIHNGGVHTAVSTVPAGSTVHDKVTVSGGYGTPSGTATFKWFANNSCSGAPLDTSAAQALVNGSVDATGFTEGPLAVGSYSFQTHYDGNTNYTAADGMCEPLTVTKVTPSISTIPAPASAALGATLSDNASLAGGFNPTGSVTFTLYSPADATCTGAPSYTALDATAPYSASPGLASNAVGVWHWKAAYAGDVNNNSVTSLCSDEPVTISKGSPTVSTTIKPASTVTVGTVVHDEVTVTGSTVIPTGTINFTLYKNKNCGGGVLKTDSGIPLVSGFAQSSNFTTVASSKPGISYQATYNGDANYNSSVGVCEPLTVN